jgi:hypothetical protein
MSSKTSTDQIPPKHADQTPAGSDMGLEAWQFFLLAALGCATAALFLSRGRGFTVVILLTALMAAAAWVGLAALRTLRPLVAPDGDQRAIVGRRTRAVLEREKLLTLRAIKDLEFDHAMGKLSETDWQEMSGRLRARAAGLIRQLDAGDDYRDRIEQDLAGRLASAGPPNTPALRACPSCTTVNDGDARFCKSCGERL